MNSTTKRWHAKLYKFTYDSNLPDNLCPYFWKVIFALIMFLFNLILQLPWYISTYFRDSFLMFEKHEQKNSLKQIAGFIFYFLIIMSIILIYGEFQFIFCLLGKIDVNKRSFLIDVVILFNGVALLMWLLITIQNYLKKRKAISSKIHNDNILKEFIKASYYKYCPKINWIDKENNNIN